MSTHDRDPERRDPTIARALGEMPVPPRPADFFDRLDDALDAVDEVRRATPAAAVHRGDHMPVDLTENRSDEAVADLSARRRAKSGRRYRVLAAAASVAVVLGGVAVLARDDGTTTTVDPAGRETPGTTDTAASEARIAALEAAAKDTMSWSQAVGDGDAERAWSLMGPLSRAYLTGQGGWDEMFLTMSEGSFGRWHQAGLPAGLDARHREGEDVRTVSGESDAGTSVVAAFLPGTEDAAVVTLSAVFELEGVREEVLDAFPLTRAGEGEWRIEPFAFGPGETVAEFITPAVTTGGGLEDARSGFTVEVAAPGAEQVAAQAWPEDAGTVAFDAHGGGFRPMSPAGQDRWTDRLSAEIPGGSVRYVVATRGPEFFTAHPVEFFVKGGEAVACSSIGFTPESDDLASGISIVSGECAEAERLVRHVHEELRHNFFDGPRWFTALGYECTVRTESEGLESGLYRCIEGPTLISWRKT